MTITFDEATDRAGGDAGTGAGAVQVEMLGAFRASVGGAPVRAWRGGKCRGLFQYLVLRRERVVGRDQLAQTLWPDREPQSAHNSLKVAVHALRRVLDGTDDLRVVHTGDGYLMTGGTGVRIDCEEIDRLARAVREAERRSAPADEVAALHERAAAVYRGEFLPGETADWVLEQREWYRAGALALHDGARRLALRREDTRSAIVWSRRSIEIDPCHEPSFRTLIRVHGLRGERSTAARWYARCRARLRSELGVDPEQATDDARAAAVGASARVAVPR